MDITNFNSQEFKDWLNYTKPWDLLVSCIGTLEPVGRFDQVDIQDWVNGVAKNSTFQIAALMNALPNRNKKIIPTVIFFAGGGTNSATPSYSSYTIGKIAMIKAVELLDSEFEDIKFSILGPGWVKTKIHQSTLETKNRPHENYNKTKKMLTNPEMCNPIEKVIDDIYKLIDLPKSLVGGRNFSSVHDNLDKNKLKSLYEKNVDFYKLRRNLNDA